MPYLNNDISSKIFYASASSDILHIARATTDLINMVTRVNLLLIRIKKQGSKCVHIISLLKEIFGKHFKVYHKFGDSANGFIKLFSVCIFLCKYESKYSRMEQVKFFKGCLPQVLLGPFLNTLPHMYICVYFMCVVYVFLCICCRLIVVVGDIDTSFTNSFSF